jgi:parvulin-like peptidyl-prolyl isomerase
MLPQLHREIVIDQAIAEITCTSAEVAIAQKRFCQQHQLNSDADLQVWLNCNHLTDLDFIDLATRQDRIETFKQNQWGHQLESYFLKHKRNFDRAIYSLIRMRDWQMAQEIYFRIAAGEQSFADLAQEYSQGTEAQTGGLVGPVELGTLHPGFVQKLITSQLGQLSPPGKLGDWIIIVRMERLIPAQLDKGMRQRLLNQLFEEWIQEQLGS